jgi:hypothetical protein
MRDDRHFEETIAAARALIEANDDDNQARLAAICGHVDVALTRLEAELAAHPTSLSWVRRDPDFDLIRDDSRFQSVLNR